MSHLPDIVLFKLFVYAVASATAARLIHYSDNIVPVNVNAVDPDIANL